MSSKVEISTIYRATVRVPMEVYEAFGHTREYDVRFSQIATRANVGASGQDAYSDVYVWAEDSSRTCVENFAAEWELFIAELQRRLGESHDN